ncbi:MAG: RNase J family beta-CASP ribonuclease [Oscillospiraceae bacterium]|jgi:ribonuclease J|nr:RNase J family beta-CASP ribonuclease [Oscillospiraceae bacterium]
MGRRPLDRIPTKGTPIIDAITRGKNPLDALLDQPSPITAPPPSDAPRRRGRPPKSAAASAAQINTPVPQSNQPTLQINTTAPQSNPPRRGRPPKSGYSDGAESSARSTRTQPEPAARDAGANRANAANGLGGVKIAFLGGLGEVGKNITLYEYGDDMLLVDCGLAFPDADMPGVDLVIPDFSYVARNADKIRGIVITHGHEDHIGALPYLLKEFKIPVFATRLTIGLITGKLREHGLLHSTELNEVEPGQTIYLGAFQVETIHVNHSIPDALALAIHTAEGVIIQTGDFKIDSTPIDGGMIDLARFAELGKKGVLCLLSDSTNAERPGYTQSERIVGESFGTLFRKAEGRRLIVASFASNIHRIQQIIDVASGLGRKVALSGRSLENVTQIGAELGYLKIPENTLIPLDVARNYPDDKLVIITTGSQGEPMSALTRMAFSEHRKIEIRATDCVIISATPIPGNEKTVGRVINELLKKGAEVVYEKMYDVHVSGHACQEELKLILGLTNPKYFIPVHGELKHLRKHAGLALSMGMPKERVLIAENGSVAIVSQKGFGLGNPVPAGRVFVDGFGVGDVGSIVLRDRKLLAQDGIMVLSMTVSSATYELVAGPEVFTRGFVYVKEAEELIEAARRTAAQVFNLCVSNNMIEMQAIKSKIRDTVGQLLFERTKRSPMILPVIMEV